MNGLIILTKIVFSFKAKNKWFETLEVREGSLGSVAPEVCKIYQNLA